MILVRVNNFRFKKSILSIIIIFKKIISHLILAGSFNNWLSNNIKSFKIIIIELFNILSNINKIKIKTIINLLLKSWIILMAKSFNLHRLLFLNLRNLLHYKSIFILFFLNNEAFLQMLSRIYKNLFNIFNHLLIFNYYLLLIKYLIIGNLIWILLHLHQR